MPFSGTLGSDVWFDGQGFPSSFPCSFEGKDAAGICFVSGAEAPATTVLKRLPGQGAVQASMCEVRRGRTVSGFRLGLAGAIAGAPLA